MAVSRSSSVRRTQRFVEGLRELRRTPVRFAFHLAVARLLTQWRSLLTIVAGTILSASIGALVPLYTTAIAQVGMTQRLAEEPSRDGHAAANISLRANEWRDSGGLEQQADGATGIAFNLVDQDLGVIDGWVDEVVFYVETEAMGLSLVTAGEGGDGDEVVPLVGVRNRMAYYTGWQDEVRVVSGRLPEVPSESNVDVEVVIGLNVANEINLEAGTLVVLDQGLDQKGQTGGGHPSSQPITARIVGVVSPLDDEAAYWMEPSPLRLLDRQSGAGLWDYELVFLTTREAVFRAAGDYLPDTPTRVGWRVLFAHDNLPFSRVDTAREALRTFERNMRYTFKDSLIPTAEETAAGVARQDLAYNYHTRLIDYDTIRKDRDDGILLDYAKEVELLDAPFGLLLLQVGALVLFYLMVTAALVRRGERREIAMLQSRGAWDSQIILLRGIEALLICVAAVIVAPFLSQMLLTALGPTVANTDEFPLPLTQDVFLFAGLAAVVTFLTLMLTLRPVLRLPLVLAGGAASRSERQHWWQRYYVDVMLALVGLGALWLLVRRGSPLADVNLGGQQADPLMLMAPALLFLALGGLALRFFPILAALAARVSAAGRGLLNAMASWQLSREPVHYGRITFLLALAIGIGWFATSFRATVSNSHEDQAKYLVGTDARFIERDARLNVNRARPASYYLAQDDVTAASTAFRVINANLSTSIAGELRGDILAIDPDTFGGALYWRSDLGAIFTPRAPGDPPDLPQRGEELPIVPETIGMWARFETSGFGFSQEQVFQASVARLTRRTHLSARLLDSDDAWITVPFEPVEIEYLRSGVDAPGAAARGFVSSGWVYLEADLSALDYVPQGPVRLVSMFWEYRSPSSGGERGLRLTLADMTLFDAAGTAAPVSIFKNQPWEFAYDRGATVTGRSNPGWSLPTERDDAVYFSWDQDAQRTIVGGLLNYPDLGPIDAVVSRRVQEENGLTFGLDATPFSLLNIGGINPEFRAVQVTEYYPSLFNRAPSDAVPKGDSFMVVDVRELMYRINRRPSATVYPDEVWLRFGENVDVQSENEVSAFLRQFDSAESEGVVILSKTTLADELGKLRTNPLGLGLLGLMYLAFIMALALSVVGLLTYAGLTAQSRRTEFGVLRALGLSSLRVVGGLALEQLFVMAIGVSLGAVLGWLLSSQVVPTLALGATGESVIPPFVMRVEVQRLLEYGAMMVAMLGLVLASSLLLVRQLSLARTLRLGEE
ncbi:MAG: ABC transporter permease [Anaerolineae bacterium]|nr:ABC transporter permease [Anaerolineae bacterium]